MNETKQIRVIGHPISHSKSPLIHNYWIKLYGLNAYYDRLDVLPRNLSEFVNSIQDKTFFGANVTLPHKIQILPMCNQISKTAKSLGAVNTLYLHQNKLVGDNTDTYGFLANLDQLAPKWAERSGHAIVLGAGGAARAIICGLMERGFQKITILNRTVNKAQDLADYFGKNQTKSILKGIALSDFPSLAMDADFLVNASAIGLNGSKFENLNLDLLPTHCIVHDIVYTPLQTPLLAQAEQRQLQTVDGLGMLLHQAAPGFKKWFGIMPQVSQELRQLAIEALNKLNKPTGR